MSGNSNARDANFIPVLSAKGDNFLTLPWSIDSVTGRVLMTITVDASDTSPSLPYPRARKDANFRNTLTGLSDDGLKQPLSVAIDQNNSLMGVDVALG